MDKEAQTVLARQPLPGKDPLRDVADVALRPARGLRQGRQFRPERQRLTPDLAESWKVIDATTWEFKLRRNVRFHDGTPFTADDVIFSFERAPNVEGSPSSFGIYAKGKQFIKIDDHTLHVKTAAPYPLMPNDV